MSPHMSKLSYFTAVFLCGAPGLAKPFFYLTCQCFVPLALFSISCSILIGQQLWHFMSVSTLLFTCPNHANCPFHNRRNRFRVGLLRYVLTPARFHYAHTHCPSHHPHLCCCHSLFISRLQYTLNMFRSRSQRQSNQCFV